MTVKPKGKIQKKKNEESRDAERSLWELWLASSESAPNQAKGGQGATCNPKPSAGEALGTPMCPSAGARADS